jgi:hypothetical protein
MYFVFFALISRPTSLPASKSVSVFSFIVFVLSPNKLTPSIQFQTDFIFLDFLDDIF